MYVTAIQLMELGVSKKLLECKIANGDWIIRNPPQHNGNETEPEVLLSSLPKKLQLKWAKNNSSSQYPGQIAALLSEAGGYGAKEQEAEIVKLLSPLTPTERIAWIDEALRLAHIIELYSRIKPKRQRDAVRGTWEFMPGVYELCREAVCKNLIILTRYPHRANAPSPHRLDDLYRDFRRRGLLALLPKVKKPSTQTIDKRRAVISSDAIEWLNDNWSNYSGPTHLYKALERKAGTRRWKIPSQSWVSRLWDKIPKVVKVYRLDGKKAYESKLAPYVPRDYSDLRVLQVLCGDHSERDVTVSLPDNSIARPWLTLWCDLRSGLIWGKCICLVPSSFTAGLAYADGVQNFGAQPLSRPEEEYSSYIYTDRGRDYKSHSWDGKVIAVHHEAMNISGALEMLRVQRRVGILDGLNLKHLLAKGRNPKEKPVERVHRDISDWEQNTFAEYCGRDPKSRPERWQELFTQHQRFLRGKRSSSPFLPFDLYREKLDEFITRYNSTEHERLTLGSARIVPIEEYKRLYTTRYEIAPETLALVLMKPGSELSKRTACSVFKNIGFITMKT